jgi:hypothetical protein
MHDKHVCPITDLVTGGRAVKQCSLLSTNVTLNGSAGKQGVLFEGANLGDP